jgi:ElaB/YqjD/DUF883 family membrane-anchored ribosome-binding protein
MTKTSTHQSRISTHVGSKNGQGASDLKDLISEAKSSLGNLGEHASDDLRALKDRLSANLKTRVKTIAKAARRQAGRVDDKIRANPYQAMGIAAGIGLIAGLLIARRRSAR